MPEQERSGGFGRYDEEVVLPINILCVFFRRRTALYDSGEPIGFCPYVDVLNSAYSYLIAVAGMCRPRDGQCSAELVVERGYRSGHTDIEREVGAHFF